MEAARYKASGPVSEAFQRSEAIVRGIMGPVGSGKTALCLMEPLRRGLKQAPSPIERIDYKPVRMSRWVFLRDTYRNLDRTTIPSWQEWVPKDAGEGFKGGKGDPGNQVLVVPLPDGTVARMEFLFIALGDNTIEDVYRGFPMTGIYLNEADRIHIDALRLGMTRVGRYPAMRHAGPTWRGVWCDFNAPNHGDDMEKFFISEKLPTVDFFPQPGGMDPGAENLENLPPDYYEKIIENSSDTYYVDRMVHNKLGNSRDGKPVYREFSDNRHVSNVSLKPLRGLPIYIGVDAGRWPSAVFTQVTSQRQIIVLDELVMEDVGATTFGEALGERVAEKYSDFKIIGASDPSADNPTETSNKDDDAWVDIVTEASKIKFKGTFSNKRVDREEGPKMRFKNDVAPQTRGIRLSGPDVPILRQALQHGFQYKKLKVGGGLYQDKPHKNEWSHVAEGFEYAVQRILGKAIIRNRQERRKNARSHPTHAKWRPTGF